MYDIEWLGSEDQCGMAIMRCQSSVRVLSLDSIKEFEAEVEVALAKQSAKEDKRLQRQAKQQQQRKQRKEQAEQAQQGQDAAEAAQQVAADGLDEQASALLAQEMNNSDMVEDVALVGEHGVGDQAASDALVDSQVASMMQSMKVQVGVDDTPGGGLVVRSYSSLSYCLTPSISLCLSLSLSSSLSLSPSVSLCLSLSLSFFPS